MTVESFTYPIIDTNQLKCYDDHESIISPSVGSVFYGQDGNFISNPPTYQENDDGTVSDLLTGLVWQQDPGEKMSFDDAVATAGDFSLAGYDDWRLPSIKELYSLIDFSGITGDSIENSVPYIDIEYFSFEYGNEDIGERIIDSQYWSRTEYVSTTMWEDETVFGVNFADGRIKGYTKTLKGSDKAYYVIYVRGNPDYGVNSFVDNEDGTIFDQNTGLMWAKADSEQGMDWKSSLIWVSGLNDEQYLGYDDWRLPDAKELQSIVDYSRSPDTTNSAAIDPIFSTTKLNSSAYPYDDGEYAFY